MLTETNNLPQFEAVRDSDEQILWTGKPVLIPFILSGIPSLIMGLIWGILDLSFFGGFSRNQSMGEISTFLIIFYGFLQHHRYHRIFIHFYPGLSRAKTDRDYYHPPAKNRQTRINRTFREAYSSISN